MKLVFFTRFAIGVFDKEWIDYRVNIFSVLTYPSVKQFDKDLFKWYIFVDSDMPAENKKMLERLVGNDEKVELVELDFYYQYSESVVRIADKCLKEEGACWFGKVDDDDALNGGISEVINKYDGYEDAAITFPFGMEVLNEERVYVSCNIPFLSMNTFIKIGGGENNDVKILARGHTHVKKHLEERGVPIFYENLEHAYIYSRHKQADSRFSAVRKKIMDSECKKKVRPLDLNAFGVDYEDFIEFSSYSRKAGKVPSEKTWLRARELNEEAKNAQENEKRGIKNKIVELNSSVLIKKRSI